LIFNSFYYEIAVFFLGHTVVAIEDQYKKNYMWVFDSYQFWWPWM